MARVRGQVDGASDISGLRRKRRASAASIPSEADELAGTTSPSQSPAPQRSINRKGHRAKRPKRFSQTSSQQLEAEAAAADASDASDNYDNIIVTQELEAGHERKVHFSQQDPVVEIPTSERSSSQPPKSSALTPHFTRSSVSPGPSNAGRRRNVNRLSLPAELPSSSPAVVIEEHQFSPISQVIDPRSRRRLRRSHLSEEINNIEAHNREDARKEKELARLKKRIDETEARLREAEEDLEVKRQMIMASAGEEDEKAEKMRKLEEEIEKLRQDQQDHNQRAEQIMSDSFDPDAGLSGLPMADADMSDDVPTLVEPADFGHYHREQLVPSKTPESADAEVNDINSQSQGTQASLPDPNHEVRIKDFEHEVRNLHHQLAEIQAEMLNLSVGLRNMGFTSSQAAPQQVLEAMRSAFSQARQEFAEIATHDDESQYQNREFILVLVDNIRNLHGRVKALSKTIVESEDRIQMNQAEISALKDKLSNTHKRNESLQKHFQDLDKSHDRQAKRIVELEEEVEAQLFDLQDRDTLLAEKDQQIGDLSGENEEQTTTNERLRDALSSYEDEVKKMEGLIERMETEHKDKVTELEDRLADTVADLTSQLENETSNRRIAEGEIDEKTTENSALQVQIEAIETELEGLRQELADVQAQAAGEQAQKEDAQADLEDRNALITELETRIEDAHVALDELRDQVKQLTQLIESERRQREAAETELDQRNAEIADLESRLHDEGIQSNELRSKLFEVQMRRDREVQELEDAAAEKEDQYQADMASEIERRENAEQTITELEAQIASLQASLNRTESAIDHLQAEKDQAVTERDEQIENLAAELDKLGDEFEALTAEKNAQVSSLHNDVATLSQEVADQTAFNNQLQKEAREAAQAHAEAIEAANDEIDNLKTDLSTAQDNLEKLESEKLSLEHRVDTVSQEYLDMSNDYADKFQAQNQDLKSKNELIDRMQREASAAAAAASQVIAIKEEELENASTLADNRGSDLATLTKQLEDLKEAFVKQVAADKEMIQAIVDTQRDSFAKTEILAKHHQEDADNAVIDVLKIQSPGAKALQYLQSEDSKPPEMVEVNNHRVRTLKTRKSKRKNFDSGIGMEMEETEEAEAMLA